MVWVFRNLGRSTGQIGAAQHLVGGTRRQTESTVHTSFDGGRHRLLAVGKSIDVDLMLHGLDRNGLRFGDVLRGSLGILAFRPGEFTLWIENL